MADVPEYLGKIIPADAVVGRDAFHVPCAPVVAGDYLQPGVRVGLWEGKAYRESAVAKLNAIGIVDPLLSGTVQPGDRFLLWIFPGTITGLRHVWSHHAFEAKPRGLQ